MTATASAMSIAPGSLRAWVLAARPATLSAALVPVLTGTACAYAVGALSPLPALLAALGAMLIQIGTNFANDVFDHEKGADTATRLGPTRAVAAGLLRARDMRVGMVVAFGLATLSGAYLVYVGGLPIVVIGLLSIASGIAYTGGPYPLGYHGLGDVFVMIFFGFVAVCGTTYVQAGSVPPVSIFASVPVGALATAILAVNNIRDREGDAEAGKRTLAVRFGRRAILIEYAALLGAAYLTPVAMWVAGVAGPFVLLPCLTLPLALGLYGRLARGSGKALNGVLVGTAKLLLVYGVALTVGISVGPHFG